MATRTKSKGRSSAVGDGLRIESVPIDSLTPHPRNVRQGDLVAVIESVRANGCYRPLVCQRSTRHILAGNHLWRALKSLGNERADVVFIDCDDGRALRIMLADNRTADLGGYDDADLAKLLQDIQSDTNSLLGTGYDDADLNQLLETLNFEAGDYASGAPPPSVQQNIEEMQATRKKENAAIHSNRDTERYVIIVFPNRAEKEKRLKSLGLSVDERYISSGAVRLQMTGQNLAHGEAAPKSKSGATG